MQKLFNGVFFLINISSEIIRHKFLWGSKSWENWVTIAMQDSKRDLEILVMIRSCRIAVYVGQGCW